MKSIHRQAALLCIVCAVCVLGMTTPVLADISRDGPRAGILRGPANTASESAGYTLFVSVERYGVTETVVVSGLMRAPGYRLDPGSGTRFVAFAAPDAARIATALADAGVSADQIFSFLVDSTLPVRGTAQASVDSPLPVGDEGDSLRLVDPQLLPVDRDPVRLNPVNPEPLDPNCSECLNGNLCNYGGELRCCSSGGSGCMVCGVCPPD